jgi:hypothetical protein
MTASDKKKTAVLVLLLAGAGLSWSYTSRPAPAPAATVAGKAPAGKTRPPNIVKDAAIHIDTLVDTSGIDVGKKNLFLYGQKPTPPKPAETIFTTAPQANVIQASQQQQAPYVPPPPAWKAFRYEGFSVSKGGGKILGSITESGTTYEVKEGDCMMGMYCITRLTESLVEIEDLQLKRKQTFTFTRPQ